MRMAIFRVTCAERGMKKRVVTGASIDTVLGGEA